MELAIFVPNILHNEKEYENGRPRRRKLGFGEKTVEETCRESGVNCDTFLLIANVYATEGYVPTTEMMTAASAIDLVRYLHASHSYYLDHEIQDLSRIFEDLLSPCTPMQRDVIMRFFDGYREEVENHFAYEEDIVFPYVRSVAGVRLRGGHRLPLRALGGRRTEGRGLQHGNI